MKNQINIPHTMPVDTLADLYANLGNRLVEEAWPNRSNGPPSTRSDNQRSARKALFSKLQRYARVRTVLMWTVTNQNRCKLSRPIGVLHSFVAKLDAWSDMANYEGYDHGLRANGTR